MHLNLSTTVSRGSDQAHFDSSVLADAMRRFECKRVLVTGSGRGIGQAIADRFAAEGDRVQLVARSQPELDQAQESMSTFAAEVRATALDLTMPDAAQSIVTEVEGAWGGLDILVTNAGAAPQGSFLEGV